MAKATYYKPGGATPVLDQFFVSVLDKRLDGVIDQKFSKRPIYELLLAMKDTNLVNGAEQFLVPMSYLGNPNGGMIDPDEGLSMDDYDPFTAGRYDPKYAAYGVAWPMEVQSINKGDTRVFSLIDKKIDNTVETLRDTLADQLINGSGAGKNANGLTTLIPATAKTSQSASVGGISPSGNLWWQTQAINMTGMSAATDLENQMLVMYDTIFAETGDPDTIVTDITTKETYENNAKDFITLNGKTKIADVTFEMCQYKGMPIIYDKNAPAGELRMLTREYIKFCVDPDFWFAWTARKDLPNVPFKKVQQVVCKFQFARTSARAHGCIYNIAV